MEKVVGSSGRGGERGAVSIKTILSLLLVAAVLFTLVKLVPVYVEQGKVIYGIDELARVAALRGWKEEKITNDINKIRGEYNLPDGSINFLGSDKTLQIKVGYTRTIDLLVTTINWQVEHTSIGKEL